MLWLNWLLSAIGILTLAGGVQGMVNSGSAMSLIGSAVMGGLILGGIFVHKNSPRTGRIMSLVGCLGLTGFFTFRFFTKGFGIWPAGVMMVAGLVGVVSLLAGHLMAVNTKSNA